MWVWLNVFGLNYTRKLKFLNYTKDIKGYSLKPYVAVFDHG